VILVLHNRYRVTGGEERVVADLAWLAREHLGEDVEVLERDSADLGRARAAAGLLRGGSDPAAVAAAVRRRRARVVHAHNPWPAFGPRALEAARAAGARVVLHLHNFRLVCAVGTCFNSRGEDCVRCHGRDTWPGVRLNCRGDRAETVVYAAALARWQRRMVDAADAFVVPSAATAERLERLGARLPGHRVHVVGHVVRGFAERSRAAAGRHALVVARLAPEKGVDLAVDACALAGVPLVVAGDGPLRAALEARARAAGGHVRFAGRVPDAELAELRAGAAVALVPSRSAETFGLAAAEAMAAGVPVVAAATGALPELAGPGAVVAPGDARALAAALTRRWGDERAGDEGLRRVREVAAPAAVAARLEAAYDGGRG
jgi:glycosyltransferase involved in cell wall biosynthesis